MVCGKGRKGRVGGLEWMKKDGDRRKFVTAATEMTCTRLPGVARDIWPRISERWWNFLEKGDMAMNVNTCGRRLQGSVRRSHPQKLRLIATLPPQNYYYLVYIFLPDIEFLCLSLCLRVFCRSVYILNLLLSLFSLFFTLFSP